MRRLILNTFVSLDGVMQAPGGPEEDPTGGFDHGGWAVTQWDDLMWAAIGETMGKPFDLVLANILLPPLKRLATPMAGLLAPGARVILSGLLPEHANAARAAYAAQGLALERHRVLDGWATLVLRRGR